MRSIITVTVPPSGPELVTLDELKLELGITGNDQDDKLAAWIAQASQIAASYCQTVLAAQTVSEIFRHSIGPRGDGCTPRFYHGYAREAREMLVFGCAPVSDVASVTVDDALLGTSHYEHDDDRLFRLNSSGYPTSWTFNKSIVVVYTSGFFVGVNVPADLKRAILMLIRDARGSTSRDDPMLKSRETVGVSKLEWWVPSANTSGNAFPVEITGLLDQYRRPWGYMT